MRDRHLRAREQLRRAAVAAPVGAALSWIGLLHAAQVGWAAAPGVAIGYLPLDIWSARSSSLTVAADPALVQPVATVGALGITAHGGWLK